MNELEYGCVIFGIEPGTMEAAQRPPSYRRKRTLLPVTKLLRNIFRLDELGSTYARDPRG